MSPSATVWLFDGFLILLRIIFWLICIWLYVFFGWTTLFTGTSACQPHLTHSLWPLHMFFIQFATGVRHQQGDLREDCVCTWRAAQRCVQSTLCLCFLCVSILRLVIWTCVCVCLADLCRDQFSRCGVAAQSGQCASLGGSCGKSCGGCWLSTEIRDTTCPDTAALLPLIHILLLCPPFSSQFLLIFPFDSFCTTHYSCAKSTSAFEVFCSVYLCLFTCMSAQ